MFPCSRIIECSDAFIDDELENGLRLCVHSHLQDCRPCAALVEQERALKQRVYSSVRGLFVPDSLRTAIKAQMGVTTS